jgi:hypothetical protein
MKQLENKGYIQEIGKKKSERGPVAELPLYSLTIQGFILAGLFLKKRVLIFKALDMLPKQDNPIWKFSLSIIKESTEPTTYSLLIGDYVLKQLLAAIADGTFDPETFSRTILLDNYLRLAQKSGESNFDKKEMQTVFEKKYNELDEKEQRAVFQYLKNNIESMFLNKLTGQTFWKYSELARNSETIHAVCSACRKIVRVGTFPIIDTEHKCER